MAVKAIFAECSNHSWLEVAINLKRENDWEPCYWIAISELENAVKQEFPNVVFHKTMDAIRGIKPLNCKELNSGVVDEALLKDLSIYESTVFGMMDRMDPGNAFTYQERTRLYHYQLKYWLSMLEHYKPDVAVFPCSPHIVYDYILYIVCRRQGVKIVTFSPTIEDFFCPVENFEDELKAITSRYKELLQDGNAPRINLSLMMEDYWRKLSSDYSVGIPADAREPKESAEKRLSYILNFIKRKFRALFKYIRFFYDPAPPNYIKQKDRNFEEAEMTYFNFINLCGFQAKRKKIKLKLCYDSLAENISLNKPYIYVPLHYQPEKTTSPDGGVFTSQLLMIDMLSKLVPQGWDIYVKEHLGQFSFSWAGERSRISAFYHDVASLPNVKLAPLSMSPFDLIDSSKVVATVTGTTGIEALIRGKPVLIFGYAWYRDCEGAFYTPTKGKCQEALLSVEKGYKVDREKVKTFIKAVEQACFKGYGNLRYKDGAECILKKDPAVITRAIQSLYEGKNSKMAVL